MRTLECLAGGFAAVRHYSAEDDSHDDFKPKVKAAAAAPGSVASTIEQDISSHDVFIYMKARGA